MTRRPRDLLFALFAVGAAASLTLVVVRRESAESRGPTKPSDSSTEHFRIEQKYEEAETPATTAPNVPGSERVEVRPAPTLGAIIGRVVDDRTDPIEGARISWNGGDPPRDLSTTSDSAGAFRIEGVPIDVEGRLRGSAISDPDAPIFFGFDSPRLIDSTPADAGTLVFARPVRIRGRVLDDAGDPIPGAFVRPADHRSEPWVESDEEGRFEFASEEFGEPKLLAAEANGFVSALREEQWLDFAVGARIDGVELRLVRSEPRKGRVIDAMGEPVEGASIFVFGPSKEFITTRDFDPGSVVVGRAISDGDGRFEVPYALGHTKRVRAHHPYYALTEVDCDVDELELRLKPLPFLRLRLLDAATGLLVDTPRIRVELSFHYAMGLGQSEVLDRHTSLEGDTWRVTSRREPADGPQARNSVRVAVNGFVSTYQSLHAKQFAGDTITLALERGNEVSGSVRHADGAPASHATIWVRDELEEASSPRVLDSADDAGRFVLSELPKTIVSLFAETRYEITSSPTRVDLREPPATAPTIELVFPALGTLEGTVTRGGAPLATPVEIRAKIASDIVVLASTDALGRFRAEHVPPSDYDVFAASQHLLPQHLESVRIHRVRLEGGRSSRLDLDLVDDGMGFVTGYATIDGRAAIGSTIDAFYEDGQADGPRVEINASGRFEFPPLVPGEYTLSLTSVGATEAIDSRRVRVERAEARDIEFSVRTGSLRGQLRDGTTQLPLRDVALRRSTNIELFRVMRKLDASVPEEVETSKEVLPSPDGSFAFERLAVGEYVVWVDTDDAHYCDDQRRVVVTPDSVAFVDLSLLPSGSLDLEIEGLGDEYHGARIQLLAIRDDETTWEFARSLYIDGSISIDPVPPGTYRAQVFLEEDSETPGAPRRERGRELGHVDFTISSRAESRARLVVPN